MADGSVAGLAPPVLHLQDLVKHFSARVGLSSVVVHAVCGVTLEIPAGTTLALVGESGCGKSTVGRAVVRLLAPDAGSVRVADTDLATLRGRALREARRAVQVVFQDVTSALDPRLTIRASIAEPMLAHGMRDHSRRVAELLEMVGLGAELSDRYPHELSGGQRQRVGIARALGLQPQLIVLDEAVSALDASVRAGVLELLLRLQTELGVAYLLISHDIATVAHVAHTVAVMHLGKIVEMGPTDSVLSAPAHPYTKALLSAVPDPDPLTERARTRIVLIGEVPSAIDPPSGCRFRTRCWKADTRCAELEPELVERGGDHPVACHYPEDANVPATRARRATRKRP